MDDLWHGYGIEILEDGAKYKGTFVNGIREGKAKIKLCDGSKYKGEFKNNMMHGYGTYTY